MRTPSAVGLALALTLVATTARATPDYSQPGPLTATTTTLTVDAGATGGSLVVPDGAGPYPLLITSHGWSAASAQQLGWAQHFATYGFVVAVPNFPNTLTPDATVDSGIIAELVSLFTNPATSSPAQGKVDPSRIGVEGHSAGGLATSIAALKLRPGATVLFDPVDANDAGAGAYSKLCGPLLALFANPSACNNQAEWSTFATDTTAQSTTFHVVNSTHCDGENADRGALCGLACGGAADATRQTVYSRYATAFFLANLSGDTQAAATLTPSALAADTEITTITRTPGACGASSEDGGAPTSGSDDGGFSGSGSGGSGPGGGSSGGSTSSGGGAPGTAPGGFPSSTPSASSGCGCSVPGSASALRSDTTALLLVASLAIALAYARRRGSRASRSLTALLVAGAAAACGSSTPASFFGPNDAGTSPTLGTPSADGGGSISLGGGSSSGGPPSTPSCPGGGDTVITGTVRDPAGINPLYDVLVFVPAETPPAFPSGATCDQCSSTISKAVASALTGPDGKFTLKAAPAGNNIPLVIQVGKWRRQVTIPTVAACQTTAVTDANLLRLPKDHTEGDLPQMAIATGSIDPFECLLRKIGISDSEFTVPSGTGKVHMYQQNGSTLAGGGVPGAQLYGSASTLQKYDLVIFPCEGSPVAKDAASIKNLVDYSSAGGRVFTTHYSYTWLNGGAPFNTTATFQPNQPPLVNANAKVETSFPKGAAFAQWLLDVNASTTLGTLPLDPAQVRFDVTAVGQDSQLWVDTTPTFSLPGSTATESVQHYTFNTPVGADAGAQCGRVVFSDFHVVAPTAVTPGSSFPQSCGTDASMTAQEKALEFMLFDLSSCIQSDTTPPAPPAPTPK